MWLLINNSELKNQSFYTNKWISTLQRVGSRNFMDLKEKPLDVENRSEVVTPPAPGYSFFRKLILCLQDRQCVARTLLGQCWCYLWPWDASPVLHICCRWNMSWSSPKSYRYPPVHHWLMAPITPSSPRKLGVISTNHLKYVWKTMESLEPPAHFSLLNSCYGWYMVMDDVPLWLWFHSFFPYGWWLWICSIFPWPIFPKTMGSVLAEVRSMAGSAGNSQQWKGDLTCHHRDSATWHPKTGLKGAEHG